MDYKQLYDRYSKNWLKVQGFRRRGFVYKHLLSLPYQWAKRYYACKIVSAVRDRSQFPLLSEKGKPELIVSLTTFPYRLPNLHLVVKSLLMQDLLPCKICIWLSEEEFPGGMDDIDPKLKELMRYGVDICFVAGNLRSHKKYYYAFGQYPDKTVVTLDDDCIYPPDTLSRLWQLHTRFPGTVCANMAVEIALTPDGFAPFRQWQRLERGEEAQSLSFVPFGYGGVLYPAHIYDSTVLNLQLIQSLAPLADDLWLKAVQLKLGVKAASTQKNYVHPVAIPGSQKIRLMKHNEGQNMNDVQWDALDKYFGLREIITAQKQAANKGGGA